MTTMVSKGLEFPVVALPGVGHLPADGKDARTEARILYVAATRATQRLLITFSSDGELARRLPA
ncbi:MAG: 3'-5' exonuclease [Hydrogenophaga sp.]